MNRLLFLRFIGIIVLMQNNSHAQGVTSGMLPAVPGSGSSIELNAAYGEFDGNLSYETVSVGYFGHLPFLYQHLGMRCGWSLGMGVQSLRQEGLNFGDLFNYECSAGMMFFEKFDLTDWGSFRPFFRYGLTLSKLSNDHFLSDLSHSGSDPPPKVDVVDFYYNTGIGVVCEWHDAASFSTEFGISGNIEGGFAQSGGDYFHYLWRTQVSLPLKACHNSTFMNAGLTLGTSNDTHQMEFFIGMGIRF